MAQLGSSSLPNLALRHASTPPADILPGEFMLQNLCSLVAAHVLAPTPGSRVLDMCAAPGGKTTALAQLMRNEGEVRALLTAMLRVGSRDCALSAELAAL